MKLLVINFAMDLDDPVLAWQARVVDGLAWRVDSVLVLTERIGRIAPPPNVAVRRALGRPWGVPNRLGGVWLALPTVLALCLRQPFDAVFVHMAHAWIYRLGPIFRLFGIPVLLWYAHGSTSWRLRIAHRLASRVVTSTPEGFRLPSRKLSVIGQAIDTHLFRPPESGAWGDEILYVGRIAPRKRIDRLVDAMAAVARLAPESPIRLRLVGPALSAGDRVYQAAMEERAARAGLAERVTFAGPLPQHRLPQLYESAFLHLNLSETGSMDKTVMEALACGCPVLSSNPAFAAVFAEHPWMGLDGTADAAEIAGRILDLHGRRESIDRAALRALVTGRHDIDGYVDKVLAHLEELSAQAREGGRALPTRS